MYNAQKLGTASNNNTSGFANIKPETLKCISRKRSFAEMSAGSGINCQKSSLVTNIATYFDSSKFSDMTIKCNGRVFNCHRIVVCSQSKPLAAHLGNGFLESETNTIELEDDDSDIVEYLLKYLYSGDYSVSRPVSKGSVASTSSSVPYDGQEVVCHTLVYIIADKFDLPELKILAARKYENSFPKDLKSPSAIKAIIHSLKFIFTETHVDDRTLRTIAVESIFNVSTELDKNAEYDELVRRIPELSYDLYKRGQISRTQKKKKPSEKLTMLTRNE